MTNKPGKSIKYSGPLACRSFSESSVRKAVIARSLNHPLTIFPVTAGLLGGFWMWLIQPTPLAMAATIGAFTVGVANPIVHYCFNWAYHANKHMGKLTRRMQAYQEWARTEIKRILHECESLGGVEKYAAKGQMQFDEVVMKFNLFREILAKKLDPDELTYARFLASAEQVYLSTLDNLRDLVNYIKGIAAIGSDYEPDLARLKKSKDPTKSERKQLETLLERDDLKERQKQKVAELLALNEEALTEIDKTIAAFSETRIRKSQADVDINTAISELEALALRVKDYSSRP